MFNVLLDKYPDDYEGYPIDSDFQTGIKISQCLEDKELSEYERLAVACNLLFEVIPEDINVCIRGITWFLNGWVTDNHKKEDSRERVIDFDQDQWRIYSAFKSQYGIDLNTDKLHWFSFMGMLSNLEECAFTRVVEIRQKKITGKMTGDERRALKEAKLIYSIFNGSGSDLSVEEQKAVAEFMKYANINPKGSE